MVNSTTVIQGRGSGGKRLKLMKPDESDNKSNIQTLSLTDSSNSSNIIELDSTERINQSTEHIIVKSSEDFSTLIKLLQEQITTSKYTNKLLEDLISQKNNTISNGGEDWKKKEQQTIRENFRSTFPYLPANSVKDLLELEQELLQDESRQLMVKRLRQCGGKSICDTTSILLRTVMTDECATFYNYEGKNNKKLSFKDLNIHEILIDVTLFVHNDETEQAITRKIKNWLRLSNTRKGNKSGGQYRRAQIPWTEGSSSFPYDPSFQKEHQEPSFQPEPHSFQQEHLTFQQEHHAFPQDHPFQHGHSIFN